MAKASTDQNASKVTEGKTTTSGGRHPLPDAFPGESDSESLQSLKDKIKEKYDYGEVDEDNPELKPPKKSKDTDKEYDADDPSDEDKPADDKKKESKPDKKTPEEKDDEDEEVEEDELDDALVERALDLGMDAEDVEDFDNNKDLRRHIKILEKVALKNKNSQAEKGEDKKPPKKSDDNKTGDEEPEFKLELDPEIYEPKVVETLNRLNKHYHGQVAGLKEDVKKLVSYIEKTESVNQQKADMEYMDKFDSLINNLGEDKENGEFWKGEFGDGGHMTIKKKSAEFKARSELYSEMKALVAADAQRGRNTPMPTLFKKALALVYGDKMGKIARSELSEKIKKQKKLISNRPSHRESKLEGLSGRQRAAKFADDFIGSREG